MAMEVVTFKGIGSNQVFAEMDQQNDGKKMYKDKSSEALIYFQDGWKRSDDGDKRDYTWEISVTDGAGEPELPGRATWKAKDGGKTLVSIKTKDGKHATEDVDYIRLQLQRDIKASRDRLHRQPGTIFFRTIIKPISAHGSHLIYAPDSALLEFIGWAATCRKDKGNAPALCSVAKFKKGIMDHKIFCLVVIFCSVLMQLKGDAIKCEMQNVFVGWAQFNEKANIFTRFASICVLLMLRMLVSNVLPFTSPAFAYLIAKSQPPHQGYMGCVYLLVCAMPAGAIVPFTDWLLFKIRPGDKNRPEDEIENEFQFTNLVCTMTDHLPFSFWVRPYFMEPVFAGLKQMQDASDEAAASAAVLAGHFMIWCGPPTTMYQRKFVPDWITCILIQPLGLFEDVAVVLATWAGTNQQTQFSAEICLYIFMICMNGLRYVGTFPNELEKSEHLIVAVLTIVALAVKYFVQWDDSIIAGMMKVETTTPPATQPMCAVIHSNFKVMMYTAAKVTMVALICRMVARMANSVVAKQLHRKTKMEQSEAAAALLA